MPNPGLCTMDEYLNQTTTAKLIEKYLTAQDRIEHLEAEVSSLKIHGQYETDWRDELISKLREEWAEEVEELQGQLEAVRSHYRRCVKKEGKLKLLQLQQEWLNGNVLPKPILGEDLQ